MASHSVQTAITYRQDTYSWGWCTNVSSCQWQMVFLYSSTSFINQTTYSIYWRAPNRR